MRRALVLLLVLSGCATPSKASSKHATHDRQMQEEPAMERDELPKEGDLLKAALPYSILDARAGGREVPEEEFFAALAAAQAVCVGETHSNPHHHWAQHVVLQGLVARAGAAGLSVGLGMEMFERTMQGILDDYAAGRIDEAALLDRAGWEQVWGIPFWMYRPMVAATAASKLALVGLNAPKALVKKLAREGKDALSDAERAQLPTMDLDDAEHRAFFDEATGGHEMPGGGMDAFYAAQVLRDETMADVAATWLGAGPKRVMVILAGEGHCIPSAIPARIARRKAGKVIVVRPVLNVEGEVAEILAAPRADYLFVMRMPAGAGDAH